MLQVLRGEEAVIRRRAGIRALVATSIAVVAFGLWESAARAEEPAAGSATATSAPAASPAAHRGRPVARHAAKRPGRRPALAPDSGTETTATTATPPDGAASTPQRDGPPDLFADTDPAPRPEPDVVTDPAPRPEPEVVTDPPDMGVPEPPAATVAPFAPAPWSASEAAVTVADRQVAAEPEIFGLCPPLCLHHLTQELIDKTYDSGTDTWTLVFQASLDSVLPCLDHVLSCWVGSSPSAGTLNLTATTCPSNWHALADDCERSDFWPAGIDKEFTFTFVTDPATSGTVAVTTDFAYGLHGPFDIVYLVLATATTSVDLPVQLELVKTCPDTVTAGQTLTCTVSLEYPTGSGPSVTNVVVSDIAPPGVSGATLNSSSGTGVWNCVAATCDLVGEYHPGDATSFTFEATVDGDTDGTIVNEAVVTYDDAMHSEGVHAFAEVTVVAPTDTTMSVTKTGPATVVPGDPIAWTITVTNTGANPATGVVVTDVPPDEVEGAALVLVSAQGTNTWSCTDVVCTMTSGSLQPGEVAVFGASATVPPDTAPTTQLINMVAVDWDNEAVGPAGGGSATEVVSGPSPQPRPRPDGRGTASGATVVQLAGVLPVTGAQGILALVICGLVLVTVGGAAARFTPRRR